MRATEVAHTLAALAELSMKQHARAAVTSALAAAALRTGRDMSAREAAQAASALARLRVSVNAALQRALRRRSKRPGRSDVAADGKLQAALDAQARRFNAYLSRALREAWLGLLQASGRRSERSCTRRRRRTLAQQSSQASALRALDMRRLPMFRRTSPPLSEPVGIQGPFDAWWLPQAPGAFDGSKETLTALPSGVALGSAQGSLQATNQSFTKPERAGSKQRKKAKKKQTEPAFRQELLFNLKQEQRKAGHIKKYTSLRFLDPRGLPRPVPASTQDGARRHADAC
jgi:hypothetical protein